MVSKDTLSGNVVHIYDAQGKKLQKQVTENRQTQTTDYLGGFQYLDGELDFIPHAEGYVKAVHVGNTTEYHYVYNYTDHLGNIRLSYGRDPQTDEVAILKESHYYPFGLKHQGYVSTHKILDIGMGTGKVELVPVRNYLDDSYRYTFGGKEEQPELGLNWLDYHARNYDAALGRWMNVDPLAEKFSGWSPYNYTMNNPINMVDPTGMAAEWVPTVSDAGEVSYVAEAGDSAETFSSQFGVSQDKAEAITNSTGNTEIKEGTAISGETVAQNNGGNQILKLDLNSEMATEQRVFDQFVFANDVTKAYGGTEFHPADYYTNRFSRSVSSWGGLGSVDGTAFLNVGSESLELEYQLELYSSNPYADRNGFAISTEANNFGGTTGNRFPGNTGILKYNRVTPGGKSVRSENKLLIQDSQSSKYTQRLNKTFSVDRSKQIKF